MLSNQLNNAVATARTIAQVDELSRMVWQQWSAGNITDDAAQASQEAVQRQKALIRTKASQPSQRLRTTPRRRPLRNHQKSIRRRRALAASGNVPSTIACSFTTAELAVLTVIAIECGKKKTRLCTLPIAAIAALGGTSRTVVQGAIRLARHLGLVSVQERPRPGQRSDTNLLRIISSEWKIWLRLGNNNRVLKRTYHVSKKVDSRLAADDTSRHSRFVHGIRVDGQLARSNRRGENSKSAGKNQGRRRST